MFRDGSKTPCKQAAPPGAPPRGGTSSPAPGKATRPAGPPRPRTPRAWHEAGKCHGVARVSPRVCPSGGGVCGNRAEKRRFPLTAGVCCVYNIAEGRAAGCAAAGRRLTSAEAGTGNRAAGTGNRQQGTGNRPQVPKGQQAIGNREAGSGNREQATDFRPQISDLRLQGTLSRCLAPEACSLLPVVCSL